ncbi:hypothetical protein [Streptomyces sp. MBT33]|uniref:hypothetical protein n=1 Tax=Streptomyces sp. MBT33 TaxID=1488363 RepID=UPI00190E2A33|nr:hypothetical protein [Streptomyces sp. MBT33]MBK3642546.1 hypothetical protein [Streptomyces sp. MBT33]
MPHDLIASITREAADQPSSAPRPAASTPEAVHAASMETIDNDRTGVLLGAAISYLCVIGIHI